ncbi:MAG: polysaccharide pyruvyl transferase family protein [Methylacidiphilales bacterium]|nr:polysaccharide pyruvyl transferase family protein [Candidatus Methylacidiphilales bacterium]MDW8349542.1 polysaccharide pyruvyl transferase family protein [Verrucomicrobiae bacterium]
MPLPLKEKIKNAAPPKLLKAIRVAKKYSSLAWHDLRIGLFGNLFPPKPTSISMMANDICNSRCQMCLIWQQKKDYEITPDDLRQILADPLFSNVQDVGITGGEPTLRPDLPELFRVVAERRPKIPHASIITNAIRQHDVTTRILQSAEICRQNGTSFSVMVSLDGLGEIHDAVRGRKGNFESAVACIETFKKAGLPTSIGCTITSTNAPYVDELLDWAIHNNIRAHFRIAEFIDRLYNAPQKQFIRNFDPLTLHHLGLFYSRLIYEYEPNPTYKKTYRSVRGMLTEGKPRTTGCPYHYHAVILTSRGDLLYCSPKSPIIGNLLKQTPASKVFFNNLHIRKEIRQKHCDNCIHDYHVPETFTDKLTFYLKNRRIAHTYHIPSLLKQASALPSTPKIPTSKIQQLKSSSALIVGWYGTETAGDKAILHTLIHRLLSRPHPPQTIYLASLHPFYSRWTLQELHLPSSVQIIETFSPQFETVCRTTDETLIGGGPLMDIDAMNHILYAFIHTKRRNAIARIEGCGIGPLRQPHLVALTRELCRLADHITLRDQASTHRCIHEFRCEAHTVPDPATEYVLKWKLQNASSSPPPNPTPILACYFRDWPINYTEDLPSDQYDSTKTRFENGLLHLLAHLHKTYNLPIAFHAMHNFYEGGDDRTYARHLSRRLLQEFNIPQESITYPRLPESPSQILSAMKTATLNLCMRFHSVLFAHTLQVPYYAIDYTRGGKIHAYLNDNQASDRLISMDAIISHSAQDQIQILAPI